MSTYLDGGGQAQPDRRQNHRLRSIFDAIYAEIEPFFDPANRWGGHSLEHFAFRVLRESHPDLSQEEAHQIVVAATRVYSQRSLTAGVSPA